MTYDTSKTSEENLKDWEISLNSSKSFTKSNILELKNHILDNIDHLESLGLSKKEAFRIALKRIGKKDTLKKEYEKVNKWYKISNILKPYLIGGFIYMIFSKFIMAIQILLISELASTRLFIPKNVNELLKEHLRIESIVAIIFSSICIWFIWKWKNRINWNRFRFILYTPTILLTFALISTLPLLISTYIFKLNGNSMQFNLNDKLQLEFINYNIDVFKYSIVGVITFLLCFSYYNFKKTNNNLESLKS